MRGGFAVQKPEITTCEFDDMFPNEASCRQYLFNMKYPKGFVCPKCGHDRYYEVCHDINVLNGTAYDEENDRLFVTGKLWPLVFEAEKIEVNKYIFKCRQIMV